MICNHIYQCAIHKTLHGVIEEWEIFQKTHEMLQKIKDQHNNRPVSKLENKNDKNRLDELLFGFNIENIYATI